MKTKSLSFVGILLSSVLMSSMFLVSVTTSEFPADPPGEYSPWADLDDDGWIKIYDVVWMAGRYGENGTAVNKTELLYNISDTFNGLVSRIESLENRVSLLEAFSVNSTHSTIFVSTTETLNWINMDYTSLSINLAEPSLLVIMFSAEARILVGHGNIRTRALINGTLANPSDVYLNPYLSLEGSLPAHRHSLINGSYTYNFFGQAAAGFNTIQIQWRLISAEDGIQGQVSDRTLTVIAFPMQ